MALKKVTTTTLRQKVYLQLRSAILGAEILPGEVLSLRKLAESFGVSIVPVREAVLQLESEKILVVESNKKMQVNHLSAEEFAEILELRLMLESKACEKACQNRPERAVEEVRHIFRTMEKYAGVHYKKYLRQNDLFHATFYSYAQAPLLLELIKRLQARVNPYIYLYSVVERDLSSAIDCHRDMCTAFATCDNEGLIAALHRDLTGAAKIILPKLTQGEVTDRKGLQTSEVDP